MTAKRENGAYRTFRWFRSRSLVWIRSRTIRIGLNLIFAKCKKNTPIVIFSHNPLYEYYPPWNFWVRDWREVHEIVRPYSNVTNVHGHTHQVLYNEIGGMRSIGMLATAWPWPYAPEGVPKMTVPHVRVDPGDPL